MATVNEIYALLDQKAPFRTQLGFDNAGFLVGHGEQTVTNVLVALDITPEVIEEAIERGRKRFSVVGRRAISTVCYKGRGLMVHRRLLRRSIICRVCNSAVSPISITI